MRTQPNHPALSSALPFLGSGIALAVMLFIGMVSLAGTMMTTMPAY